MTIKHTTFNGLLSWTQVTMLTSMIAVGEETWELNVLLLKAADYYDQELEGLLSRLTALIEPAIILLLGGLIGSVVIGMYLPMFQLFNQIG
jgi:type IV pilus assembly protein PilC